MNTKQFAFALLPLAVSTGLWAESAQEQEQEQEMETISVTASRVERDINEIASAITIIDSQQIDSQVVTDIRDLVRYEPGVVVEGGGRFGLAGFNIRGINGDRVLTLLDGAPVADEFSFGPFLSARRDFIDVDMIERVEIIRGPASTLYGSDAIGGVVAFVSKDPRDILGEDKNVGGKAKVGYASAANEWIYNGQIAGYQGDWQWLLNATQRDGKENETFYDDALTGQNRQAADPQNTRSQSAQFKLIFEPNEFHRVSFLADRLEGKIDTQLQSQVDTRVRGVLIQDSMAIDERERTRFQVNYEYTQPNIAFDKLLTRVFWQDTSNLQATREHRFGAISRTDPTPFALDRRRDSEFEQQTQGLIVQFDKAFSIGSADHYLIYGTELQYTDSEAIRLGSTRVIESGLSLPEFSAFPARDFPISDARELSFFIQDEIQFFDGRLTLSPGLRYDEFKLSPRLDDIFTSSNPGVAVSNFDDSEVSFKLGAVYKISEETTAWMQFAEGFRIPPYDDLNVGFTNFAGGYTSLPNPELQPERVDSWEIGLRQELGAVAWSISAYYNDYENFIQSRVPVGFNPAVQLLEFQAQNRENVTIEGVDAQATWFVGESFEAMDGWQLQASLTWLNSEDEETGSDIETILPPQAVVGIGYGDGDDPWSIELVGTFVSRFDSQTQPADPLEARLFEAPGYAQFDLLGHYRLSDTMTVNGGIFNLTDREIFIGSELLGRAQDETLGRFTQAGRNIAANFTWSF